MLLLHFYTLKRNSAIPEAFLVAATSGDEP